MSTRALFEDLSNGTKFIPPFIRPNTGDVLGLSVHLESDQEVVISHTHEWEAFGNQCNYSLEVHLLESETPDHWEVFILWETNVAKYKDAMPADLKLVLPYDFWIPGGLLSRERIIERYSPVPFSMMALWERTKHVPHEEIPAPITEYYNLNEVPELNIDDADWDLITATPAEKEILKTIDKETRAMAPGRGHKATFNMNYLAQFA